MNPYKIVTKIRNEQVTLNNLFYDMFERLTGEDRLALSSALLSLNMLATEIEKEADREFSEHSYK